jgi:hypothetical protein
MNKFFKVTFLLISFIGLAQTPDKAKKLLDEMVANTKAASNITIDFKYTIVNTKEKINKENKGNVTMQDNKYMLNLMGVTKLFDGKKIYTIVPEDEEVTISKQDDADANAVTPNKIFSFFNKGFKYSWDILQKVGTAKIQYIKLTPTNTKDHRKEILIGINSRTKQIHNLIEVGKNNTVTTLLVQKYKTNSKLAANYFTFNQSKYPNYYINKAD